MDGRMLGAAEGLLVGGGVGHSSVTKDDVPPNSTLRPPGPLSTSNRASKLDFDRNSRLTDRRCCSAVSCSGSFGLSPALPVSFAMNRTPSPDATTSIALVLPDPATISPASLRIRYRSKPDTVSTSLSARSRSKNVTYTDSITTAAPVCWFTNENRRSTLVPDFTFTCAKLPFTELALTF